MHHPRWKVWLSYITDLPLRRISSSVNADMQLWLSKGQLKLTTPNAIYSYGLHYRSYANAFQKLNLSRQTELKTVLVLGWGIGSIGNLLKDQSGVEHITAVEHDEALLEFYRAHLGPEIEIPIDLICADAIEYVQSESGKFDLICSDVFVDNTTPQAVLQPAFLQQLDALRSDHGTVLLSKLNMSVADRKENAKLEEKLRDVVPAFSKLDTIGNRIFAWGSLVD